MPSVLVFVSGNHSSRIGKALTWGRWDTPEALVLLPGSPPFFTWRKSGVLPSSNISALV